MRSLKASWLDLATDDFEVASLLVKNDRLTSAMYHCQQSAEKALKGYLYYKGQSIKRTHDLVVLLKLCYEFDAEFWLYLRHVKELKPFATRSRYPDDYEVPDLEDAKTNLKYTQEVLNFVISKIDSNSKR